MQSDFITFISTSLSYVSEFVLFIFTFRSTPSVTNIKHLWTRNMVYPFVITKIMFNANESIFDYDFMRRDRRCCCCCHSHKTMNTHIAFCRCGSGCALCVDLLPIRFSLKCDTIPVRRRVCMCMRARALNSPLLFVGTQYKLSSFGGMAWWYNAIQFSLTVFASPEFIFASFFYCRSLLLLSASSSSLLFLLFCLPFVRPIFGDIYHDHFLFDGDAQISLFISICCFTSHPSSDSHNKPEARIQDAIFVILLSE